MWLTYACLSALFAGLTAILAKCGIARTDSTVATAIRTVVVLVFSWLLVFAVGSQTTISLLSGKTWIFLILSGLATGASWLSYFKALQIGDVNKVVPVDKTSTVLAILFAVLFLGEKCTWITALAMVLILIGTMFMIEKKRRTHVVSGTAWLPYAVMSAVFAALTAILGKVGIEGVESNLGTAIRTVVVLAMSWMMVFATGKTREIGKTSAKELLFIVLSGFATGGSWLCYYKALQTGPASIVVPIDKLSILVTVAFSWIVFKEKLSVKAGFGLLLIVVGTLLMLV